MSKCNFCSHENPQYQCGGCLKVLYCDKECRDLDWHNYNHKNICIGARTRRSRSRSRSRSKSRSKSRKGKKKVMKESEKKNNY